jgi:hypothetical protein
MGIEGVGVIRGAMRWFLTAITSRLIFLWFLSLGWFRLFFMNDQLEFTLYF